MAKKAAKRCRSAQRICKNCGREYRLDNIGFNSTRVCSYACSLILQGREIEAAKVADNLIDAMNLLCRHVKSRLPAGYEIVLSMSSEESSAELYGPDGKRIECYCDSGISVIDNMCCVAAEEENLKENQ